MTKRKKQVQAAASSGSLLDNTLTLDFMIGQIELKRTYENCRQLIDFLKGRLIRLATDEEVAKIEQVEQKMLDASIFPLYGRQVNVNQYHDPVQMKNGDRQHKSGKSETLEDRNRRKSEVLKDITGRFGFDDGMLCYDAKRKKISNERIAILFRKCFGIGSYPTKKNKNIQESLWILLIDERNQCAKENGEGFYRQTVLNIVGYFMVSGVLNGMPQKVAQCIFPDIDSNKVKNLKRAIPESFPEGTAEMIDLYIEKLQKGEF